jgi:glucosamine--fructose-6-phosphate aminotransferase (isomerizing)
MCGIVGYTGVQPAQPILMQGLRRLEYRGYDSAGLATVDGGRLHVRKRAGRITQLAELLDSQPATGNHGIGHTRWATHGGATEVNAHPHIGGDGAVAVVHNGVIENQLPLKQWLEAEGFVFRSQTDTEVIAHLIAYYCNGDLVEAVRKAVAHLKGTYGLAVVSPQHPGLIVGARCGSPLVLGLGDRDHFLASDTAALAGYTDKAVYLKDRQLCVLTPEHWEILSPERGTTGRIANPSCNGDSAGQIGNLPDDRVARLVGAHAETLICHVADWADVDKGDFPHYMLKEIHEQPDALENALRGRLDDAEASAHFGGLNLDPQRLRRVERIVMTGCGTSYHAGLVGEYLFEELARIPVEVEYASEFRYRNPPMERNTIVVAITQSGETADTLAALRESKRKGHVTLALCNVVGSSIAREADGGVFLHAGPEIGVASTKAFTAQVMVLTLLALYFGRTRHLSSLHGARMIEEIRTIPTWVRQALDCEAAVERIARKYAGADNFLYLGRQYLYPVALEGALKLKEISYIHAEGYPAAEMKHGPIALVDENTPSVFLMPRSAVFDKVMSNLEEIKARGGPVIAIASAGDEEVAAHADDVIYVPEVPEYLQPLVAVVPLQLLAYHIALLRGCDVDRPRNLAKSVTVE